MGNVDPEDVTIIEGSIDCPKCRMAWVRIERGDAWIVDDTTCPHLRFVIEPEGTSPEQIHYFNGMTAERLVAAVAEADRQANPEAAEMSAEEAFRDALFDHTQTGIACGPSVIRPSSVASSKTERAALDSRAG